MTNSQRPDAPPGVDLDAIARYLDQRKPGMRDGDLTATLISGGRSNLTYFLSDASHTWVLRRPPLAHVLATAHDMAREHRVISALAQTSIPVPTPILLCEDDTVNGAPFYVMEKVDGLVLRNTPEALAIGEANIAPLSFHLVEVLGQLHATDPASIGLRDFGRPEGFLTRQVSRWGKQLDSSRSREVASLDALATALSSSIPVTQRAGIVHGDYRLDNVIVRPGAQPDDGYDVAAVVDWEMSTLGDPLTDIGLLCVYWASMGSATLVPTSLSADAIAPFPSTNNLVEAYAAASGLDMTDLPWYVGFGCFKLGVILEGIHYRHAMGKTVGAGFDVIGSMVDPLAQRGLAAMKGR